MCGGETWSSVPAEQVGDESCDPYSGKRFIQRTESGREGLQTWFQIVRSYGKYSP